MWATRHARSASVLRYTGLVIPRTRIEQVEIDDNVDHVTSHGVTIAEIEAVFMRGPTIRRNKGGRTASYYAVADGIRVNFRYRPGVARPISAWRL